MDFKEEVCKSCGATFIPEPEDLEFLNRLDAPHPKECPICVWKHLLAFWPFGRFRKTKSALSGKMIITTLPESTRSPIYARDEWVSDAWGPMSYGRDYDLSRSSFEQFSELQAAVPHPHQSGINNTRCEWNNDVWSSKDCYLCRSVLDCENLSYSYRVFRSRNSIDLTYCLDTELSYDCLYCFGCYKVKHSFNARNCLEGSFLFDCRNLQNCFFCWNLRNKQYHIFNQPYSKEGYFEKLKEFNTRSFSEVEKLKGEFKKTIAEKAIHRENLNFKITNSTGNFLTEVKNCFNCYFVEESENCRYMFRGIDTKGSIYSTGSTSEKSALTVVGLANYETLVTSHTVRCRYSSYLDYCEECEYCFGCVGLRKKKYCILNKQYSEKDYHNLVAKIKNQMRDRGEWGEFFHYNMAYCGYNLSLASWYFPETKEEVEKLGGLWDEEETVSRVE